MLIATAIALAVLSLLVIAATRPDRLRVVRSARVAASPAAVHALIDDFHHWDGWSPWAKLDPAMQKTYSGASAGPGAVYEWKGNSKVGQGRMEIIASEPGRRVSLQLDFIKPFAARNSTEFRLEQAGADCLVTWEMEGPQAFPARLMGIFVNMERMIGSQFEEGLANLARVANVTAAAAAPQGASAAK